MKYLDSVNEKSQQPPLIRVILDNHISISKNGGKKVLLYLDIKRIRYFGQSKDSFPQVFFN